MFDEIKKRYKKEGTIHHAYLCVCAEFKTGKQLVEEGIVSLGISVHGNPDYVLWEGATFGIDDARALKLAESKAGVSGKRWFLVNAQYFTEEAQNALLKVFEDPSGNTHFFIIATREDAFLPTLRSRMHVLKETRASRRDARIYTTFFQKSPGDRLKIIENILNLPEEEVQNGILSFLNEIEETLAELLQNKKNISPEAIIETHRAITNARRFISKNQGSKKMLLEYIALIAPVA